MRDLRPVAGGLLGGLLVGFAGGAAAHQLDEFFAGLNFAVDGGGAGVVGVEADGLLVQALDGHQLDGLGQADVLLRGQRDGALFILQLRQALHGGVGAGFGGVLARLAAAGDPLFLSAGQGIGSLGLAVHVLDHGLGGVGLGLDHGVQRALALGGELGGDEVAELVDPGADDGGLRAAGQRGQRVAAAATFGLELLQQVALAGDGDFELALVVFN